MVRTLSTVVHFRLYLTECYIEGKHFVYVYHMWLFYLVSCMIYQDEAVRKVVDFMNIYSISQEDFDTIVELSKFQVLFCALLQHEFD